MYFYGGLFQISVWTRFPRLCCLYFLYLRCLFVCIYFDISGHPCLSCFLVAGTQYLTPTAKEERLILAPSSSRSQYTAVGSKAVAGQRDLQQRGIKGGGGLTPPGHAPSAPSPTRLCLPVSQVAQMHRAGTHSWVSCSRGPALSPEPHLRALVGHLDRDPSSSHSFLLWVCE